MTTTRTTIRTALRALLTLGTLAAVPAVTTTLARAGECPAGNTVVDGQKPGPSANKGVTDTVIASTDLAKEAPRLEEHKFRLRRLVVQPGGVVAWHSHEERPAIIYIVSGTIVEYRSTCAQPIVHQAGEVAREIHTTRHWWRNTTKKPVVLLSADILHDKADHKSM